MAWVCGDVDVWGLKGLLSNFLIMVFIGNGNVVYIAFVCGLWGSFTLVADSMRSRFLGLFVRA